MKIVTVVVTYNRKEYLIRNIEALLRQEDVKTDILIVDNASTDGTEEAVASYRDEGQIIYCNTEKNLGGAGGFNYGIRRAWELGYDYFWLMDDDVYPYPDALSKLVHAGQDLKVDYGFLAGVVLWKDGSECRMNRLHPKNEGAGPDSCYKKIDFSTFVSLFLPKKTVEEFGLPIKEFFIWGDDIEYTRRITAEKASYMVPESKVLHDTENNVGSNIALDDGRLDRYYYAYRNEMYTARKEGWRRVFYQRLRILRHISRIIFFSKGNKRKKIRLIRSATRDGRFFQPEIEYLTLSGEDYFNDCKKNNLKLCCVASSGGHWEELISLRNVIGNYDNVYITEKGGQAMDEKSLKIYTFNQINRKEFKFIFKFLKLSFCAIRILVKEKPDVIITTGALLAFPFCFFGKMLGKKIIYIESFARIENLSMTGRFVYRFADLFIVQWKQLINAYPKAVYGGSIF